MTTIEVAAPTVLAAVRDIVPKLRDNGAAAEEDRWIPRENIDLLHRAGVFRMAVPGRFGGLDLSLAEQFDVLTEIARGCGSTGWTCATWVSTVWIISLYPDRTQEEVFAGGSVKVSGGFTPGGTVTATDGGFVLNGEWRFNTGCRAADWDLLAALREHEDGSAELVFAVVPMDALEIADDWHVSAASGTGSSTVSARDVFVPAHRVAGGEEALEGITPARWNSGATGRNYGLIGMVMVEGVATYLGMARAALELFLERVPGKMIAYTNWADQREHPVTQVAVAAADNKIAAARTLMTEVISLLQLRADAGEQPTLAERAMIRGRCGYAVQLTKGAVRELHTVSGASALSRKAAFQRFYRDLEGLSLHGLMTANTNLEVHGRIMLGLEPDTTVL